MERLNTWWNSFEGVIGEYSIILYWFAQHMHITRLIETLQRGINDSFVLSPDSSDQDEINELLTLCSSYFSGENALIILDDCAVSKDLKKRSNKFIDLAFSGRHIGISVWVLTQQLTSISKPFRENVACVVSFHNPSQIAMEMLFEEYGWGLGCRNL